MRTHIPLLCLLFGCGPKAPPAPPAAPGTEAMPTAPAEAEPEPEPAPATQANIQLDVELTFADGRTESGRVIRVERGDDFYAERGWTDTPLKLTVSLDRDGKGRDATWTEISTVDIAYGSTEKLDCTYDSDFSPPMYMCLLNSKATVTTTDGQTWEAPDRYRWRFTFDDGRESDFWLYKLPARQQTDNRAEDEDYALYETLQEAVALSSKTAVTKITLTPGE